MVIVVQTEVVMVIAAINNVVTEPSTTTTTTILVSQKALLQIQPHRHAHPYPQRLSQPTTAATCGPQLQHHWHGEGVHISHGPPIPCCRISTVGVSRRHYQDLLEEIVTQPLRAITRHAYQTKPEFFYAKFSTLIEWASKITFFDGQFFFIFFSSRGENLNSLKSRKSGK